MSWLDALERREREAIGIPVPQVKPLAPHQPKPEIKSVWVQTARPRDGDAGAAEQGFYSVADGVVTMHDIDGNPTGKTCRLGPDDDAHKIAHRLARDAWLKASRQVTLTGLCIIQNWVLLDEASSICPQVSPLAERARARCPRRPAIGWQPGYCTSGKRPQTRTQRFCCRWSGRLR